MINLALLCNTLVLLHWARVTLVMNTSENSREELCAHDLAQPWTQLQISRASFLYLVNVHEVQELRAALTRGVLPPDFEAKLAKLAEGDLMHRFVTRNCRRFVNLLLAAQSGLFKEPSQADCERLLRVLAYVRKDDDALADYKPRGFSDDQQEVRAAMTELHPLLKSFKAWRLCHQVPGMWLNYAMEPRPADFSLRNTDGPC